MKRWKDLFRPHILERGLDYYMDDCVSALEKTESGYKAVVEGTENYDVEIVLRNEEIDDMTCTCPYAADGKKLAQKIADCWKVEYKRRPAKMDELRKAGFLE